MESRSSTARINAVAEIDDTCPQCGGNTVTTFRHRHTFVYGSGESAVDLTVDLPVRHCGSCEVTFLDDEAERLEHDAVCQHFGVLTPAEIRRIRESYGMTRATFAQVTGLGEATLNRWENGIMIQTLANDRYLRLLASPATMQRLRSFSSTEPSSSSAENGRRFQCLKESEDVLRERDNFQLRPAA